MTKKIIVLFLVSLFAGFFTPYTKAQNSANSLQHKGGEVVVGKVMVKLTPLYANNINPLVMSLQRINGKNSRLHAEKNLAKTQGIWLLSFDSKMLTNEEVVAALQKQNSVAIAQNDHYIEYRNTTPNDSKFNQQWQYINNGQNGGVADADIDADQAWDITTGGLTALGDTIVVAIVDDGCALSHEDWGDNLWKNYAEIPNNNIDDDGNGYTDDYLGWNAGNQDDNVEGGWHGSSVAGIVGAQGDNGKGVTGVNWNVKLMIIVNAGSTESGAVESYSYAYEHRKLYNETGGAKGSFVVATNSSWGIDFAQGEDYPIWCDFYTEMGEVGILSAGATANQNVNVDIDGDMPTSCSSEYLIAVTNLDRTDTKETYAGYGTNNVDLGAHGTDAYTIDAGGGYAGFGGTSGATPHVAGAIALLYSAPCTGLAELAKIAPNQAALKVRDYIFDGVDNNASLQGITTTEGRLNIYNSLVLATQDQTCNSTGCFAPFNIALQSATDQAILLTWVNITSAQNYILEYRKQGNATWTSNELTTNSFTLNNLQACTFYEFKVKSNCTDTTSNFSNVFTFKTDGCCEPPADITLTATDNTIQANWSAVLASVGYLIEYRPQGTTTWQTANATSTDIILSTLNPCTNYQVRITTKCAGNTNSAASNIFTIKTKGCGACVDGAYCQVEGLTDYEHVAKTELGSINNASGASENGYEDFTTQSTDLALNSTNTITITAGFAGAAYTENYRAWIDYNQDGDFLDSGEKILDNATGTNTFTVPTTALQGSTRLRVAMYYATAESQVCASKTEGGEVEDYCVNITGLACSVNINNVNATNITDASAKIAWQANAACSNKFKIEYRPIGSNTWEEKTINNVTTLTLTDLIHSTTYEVRISCICNNESFYSDIITFTTQQTVGVTSNYTPNANFETRILPNPFVNNVQVYVNTTTPQNEIELQIVDLQGKILQTYSYSTVKVGENKYEINTEKLPKGMYLLQIKGGNGNNLQRHKILKLK